MNKINTLGELIKKWLSVIKPEVTVRTYETYEWHVSKLMPILQKLPIYRLTALDIVEAMNEGCASLELSSRSIKGIYGTLRTILRRGFSLGLLSIDYSTGIRSPKIDDEEKLVFSFEQLMLIIEVARNYKFYMVIRLLAITGARLGEILGLKWKDIDFEMGKMQILRAADTRNRVINPSTKTPSGKRIIWLDAETMKELSEIRDSRFNSVVTPLNREARFEELIFHENGRPIRHRAVWLCYRRVLKKAGLPLLQLKTLRASVATFLVKNGINSEEIISLLGWSDMDSSKPYVHFTRQGKNIIDTMKSLK